MCSEWNVHGRWEAHFTVDWSEIVGGYNTPDTVVSGRRTKWVMK